MQGKWARIIKTLSILWRRPLKSLWDFVRCNIWLQWFFDNYIDLITLIIINKLVFVSSELKLEFSCAVRLSWANLWGNSVGLTQKPTSSSSSTKKTSKKELLDDDQYNINGEETSQVAVGSWGHQGSSTLNHNICLVWCFLNVVEFSLEAAVFLHQN